MVRETIDDFLRADPCVKPITDILQHYECPSECPAYCCKSFPIEITARERRILRKASIKKTESFVKKELSFGVGYEINYPCPFLENDRCTEYQRRALTCTLYPFRIIPDDELVEIYPCLLGLIVAEDILSYQTDLLKAKDSDDKESKISSSFNDLKSFKESSRIYYQNVDQKGVIFSMGYQDIIDYDNFMKNNSNL
jgi:Fe-S-cluster containining protein